MRKVDVAETRNHSFSTDADSTDSFNKKEKSEKTFYDNKPYLQ